MLIDFNKMTARTVPGMNGGTREMTAKMYMSENGKIIPCTIHKGGSIGLHIHSTSDDINYVISGTGKAVCDGAEEELAAGVCHICPKRFGAQHNQYKQRRFGFDNGCGGAVKYLSIRDWKGTNKNFGRAM